ncbi:MAG TPA: class II fructose-bisphosphate aldolase [Thermomicrobiaceae bacterium]|nr:class II fructose-bisphosphate aldolase [Thermomicrobiaceae bacterium]
MTTGYSSVHELLDDLRPAAELHDSHLTVADERGFRERTLDRLVYSAVFGDDDVRAASRWLVWQAGQTLGVLPASIHDLYLAGGRGEWSHQTTPAINVRGMSYDMARAAVRAAIRNDCKQFIFEIARSEIGYTGQRPEEYVTVVLAAALREGYRGPLFIQGDHFQINARRFGESAEKETKAVQDLTLEALQAGFYNIDIDSSTIVDLSRPTVPEQQELNYATCAGLTAFIREHQPEGVTVSVGGEIGEVGGKNSTVEELRAFMEGYRHALGGLGHDLTGISKISVQTGTSHGGVVLPDGTIADVKVDFDTLGKLSEVARSDYHIGGAVQHGASTLPEIAFNRFAEANAVEVHLATAFQNMIYDSQAFPAELRDQIYAHLAEHHADERKPGMTDAQFYYTTRKRGFGPFKQAIWDLPESVRQHIGAELEERFDLIFKRLDVTGTAATVERFVHPARRDKPAPAPLASVQVS